jgi:hypothetical protein
LMSRWTGCKDVCFKQDERGGVLSKDDLLFHLVAVVTTRRR